MLLQQIIEKLDLELSRLHRLREIIAGLGQELTLVIPEAGMTLATAVTQVGRDTGREPKVKRSFRRSPRVVRSTGMKQNVQTALTNAIPAGPVVVSAAALAREIAARERSRLVEAKVDEGTLGAMIRALGHQGTM